MEDAAVAFLGPFLNNSNNAYPAVLQAAKRAVALAEDANTFEEATAVEHEIFVSLWGGEANRGALKNAAAATTTTPLVGKY